MGPVTFSLISALGSFVGTASDYLYHLTIWDIGHPRVPMADELENAIGYEKRASVLPQESIAPISTASAAAAKSRQSCLTLCNPIDSSVYIHQAPLSLGFSRQEHWSGLPFPSPVHESEK